LFLADRNILANQAFNAFSAFDEDALKRIRPEDIRKKGKVPKNGNLFFTIFQTFMSGANDTPYFGEYDADFFDCIIIDECHRGGAKDESTWRTILEYFAPAVQLGLTATPKRNQNVDTYQYFGAPVYEYSLKAGINDGFLTPFKVKQIATTGDDYIYTSDDEILEGAIDEGKIYSIETQNRIIELMDIEAYRVQKFMEMMDQSQKTLVFCAQSMVGTSFWSPDGKPISAPEFLENLFGTLPELFKSEQDLKILWSKPNTRKKLLAALSEKGFAETQLQTFQKALCAENSDLYDILAYIAFHAAMLERTTRATQARLHLNRYTVEEQVFLDFVLNQYVELGVSELDENKLTPLLLLKYDVLTEAKRALGNIKIIRSLFVGFQAHLYQHAEGW
jgi:hypothetical protein